MAARLIAKRWPPHYARQSIRDAQGSGWAEEKFFQVGRGGATVKLRAFSGWVRVTILFGKEGLKSKMVIKIIH